jgi:hypothetical protein
MAIARACAFPASCAGCSRQGIGRGEFRDDVPAEWLVRCSYSVSVPVSITVGELSDSDLSALRGRARKALTDDLCHGPPQPRLTTVPLATITVGVDPTIELDPSLSPGTA